MTWVQAQGSGQGTEPMNEHSADMMDEDAPDGQQLVVSPPLVRCWMRVSLAEHWPISSLTTAV